MTSHMIANANMTAKANIMITNTNQRENLCVDLCGEYSVLFKQPILVNII